MLMEIVKREDAKVLRLLNKMIYKESFVCEWQFLEDFLKCDTNRSLEF